MRHAPTFALAAALAALCLPVAAGDELTPVPAQIQCKDGHLVGIRVLITNTEPGYLTLQLPPDICKPDQVKPMAPPQLPAPSTNTRRPASRSA